MRLIAIRWFGLFVTLWALHEQNSAAKKAKLAKAIEVSCMGSAESKIEEQEETFPGTESSLTSQQKADAAVKAKDIRNEAQAAELLQEPQADLGQRYASLAASQRRKREEITNERGHTLGMRKSLQKDVQVRNAETPLAGRLEEKREPLNEVQAKAKYAVMQEEAEEVVAMQEQAEGESEEVVEMQEEAEEEAEKSEEGDDDDGGEDLWEEIPMESAADEHTTPETPSAGMPKVTAKMSEQEWLHP
eukprot:gnl/TRDRNA2_/TRDRNA2_58165_c0_seq1.p1 gnl/TRDRNA2_/TRDRNA2_58165_c0~~gnl/TRDRNA2_/TRDRNA2_58165_c0_seq1.p1  ORF type:complete len:246 (-),score=86.02 gnl/TRDRNA2_/TRDRNA2_58165_c0_seq1:313-1050(-)